MRPESPVVKVSCGATGSIPGKICFTAVSIENAHNEIRARIFRRREDVDTICSGAVMSITDAAGEFIQVGNGRKLIGLKDDVVVAEAMKLYEAEGHMAQALAFRGSPKILRKRLVSTGS